MVYWCVLSPICLIYFVHVACSKYDKWFYWTRDVDTSLYFCMCIDQDNNELEVFEIIHHYDEILDCYFSSVREFNKFISYLIYYLNWHLISSLFWPFIYVCRVCELDLIFNFHKVLFTCLYKICTFSLICISLHCLWITLASNH